MDYFTFCYLPIYQSFVCVSNSVSQLCRNTGCVRVELLFFSFFSGGNCLHACLTHFLDILCPIRDAELCVSFLM